MPVRNIEELQGNTRLLGDFQDLSGPRQNAVVADVYGADLGDDHSAREEQLIGEQVPRTIPCDLPQCTTRCSQQAVCGDLEHVEAAIRTEADVDDVRKPGCEDFRSTSCKRHPEHVRCTRYEGEPGQLSDIVGSVWTLDDGRRNGLHRNLPLTERVIRHGVGKDSQDFTFPFFLTLRRELAPASETVVLLRRALAELGLLSISPPSGLFSSSNAMRSVTDHQVPSPGRMRMR